MPSQSTISNIPPAHLSVCSTTRLPSPPAPISATQLTATVPATSAVPSSSPPPPPAQHSVSSVTRPVPSSTSLAASPNAPKKWLTSDRLTLAATILGLAASVYYFYGPYVLAKKADTREIWRDCHNQAELVNTTFCEKYRQMSYESISMRSVPRHQIVPWLSKLDSDTHFSVLGSARAFVTDMITSLYEYPRLKWATIDLADLLVWTLTSLVGCTPAIQKEQTKGLSPMRTISFGSTILVYFLSIYMDTEEEKHPVLTWAPDLIFHTTEKSAYWLMMLALVDLPMLSLDERKSLARKLLRISISTLLLAITCIDMWCLADTEKGPFNGLLVGRWFVLTTMLIMHLLTVAVAMGHFCDFVLGAFRLRAREASSRPLILVFLLALVFVSLNHAFIISQAFMEGLIWKTRGERI